MEVRTFTCLIILLPDLIMLTLSLLQWKRVFYCLVLGAELGPGLG